jgi:hypothetical protein
MKKITLILCLLSTALACNDKANKEASSINYFDLKKYFSSEAKRLQTLNPLIKKTVTQNGISETKQLKISILETELKPFSNADINKSAWKNAFKVSTNNQMIRYTNTNDKIPVKELIVTKKNNVIVSIKAILNTSNLLYTSTDTLTYVPSKHYEIKKTQKIKLLKAKTYQISGRFN